MGKQEVYEAYGEEWESEMMKLSKKQLISMLKRVLMKLYKR